MRIISAVLCLVFLVSVVLSCTKEKSFEVEAPAVGSLKSDATGDCLPKTAGGAYIAGTALTDSNYLEIEVDVATAGSYVITTDTVNGYSFSGIGTFDHSGINRIRLAAKGTPAAAGQDEFTVIYDTSFCFVPVTVLPEGSTNTPAVFNLEGSGDSCIVANVAGEYLQNTPLSGTNTVAIKVNVITPGTYTISTNTVNEFSFSGSGTIANAGEQTLVLTASGTPVTEGSTVFTITAGSTTCSFSVNVAPSDAPPVTNTDLFPLSSNSWWSYIIDLNNPGDTMRVSNVGTMSFANNTYQNFEISNGVVAFDSLYYRKSGSDYYQYLNVNELIADLETDVKGDILFLKENLNTGDTWNTDFDTKYQGSDITLRFLFTCTEANTTASVNGQTYTNVYKVRTTLQTGSQGVFADAGPVTDAYYAKGIGLISEVGNQEAGGIERYIKNYKIN
jgi:hypothetical protein